jgi:hypothetical protein
MYRHKTKSTSTTVKVLFIPKVQLILGIDVFFARNRGLLLDHNRILLLV